MKEMIEKWMVTIRCFTYNQSPYICDALNGFVMQQTNFPFVILLVDDASTDGEQDVIREYVKEQFDLENKNISYVKDTDYASITFAQHKTNKNCYIVVHYLKQNHYSNRELKGKKMSYLSEWIDETKYEAICEGDDYWIDPLKLQKQFDILEKDPTISLCHHDFMVLSDDIIKPRNICIPERQNLLSVARYNYPQTLTMFYRNFREPLIPIEFANGRPVYQYFKNVRLAEYGDIYYINEPMGVYRRNINGIYSLQDKYKKIDMAITNIDRMIEWFVYWHPNENVVKALKARARSILFFALIAFLRRLQVKNCIKIICKFRKYI